MFWRWGFGEFPGWWAATVATYCPCRLGELPKFLSLNPCEWSDAPDCICSNLPRFTVLKPYVPLWRRRRWPLTTSSPTRRFPPSSRPGTSTGRRPSPPTLNCWITGWQKYRGTQIMLTSKWELCLEEGWTVIVRFGRTLFSAIFGQEDGLCWTLSFASVFIPVDTIFTERMWSERKHSTVASPFARVPPNMYSATYSAEYYSAWISSIRQHNIRQFAEYSVICRIFGDFTEYLVNFLTWLL